MIRLLPATLLACSLLMPALSARSQAFADPDFSPVTIPTDDYAKGTEALDQQRWQDAVSSFDRVISARGKHADASLYWKAYALNKLGRSRLVAATCNQLHSTFPRSTWNHDCFTLIAATADSGIYAGAPTPDSGMVLHPSQPNDQGIVRGGPSHPGPDEEQLRDLHKQLEGLRTPRYATPGDAGSDADFKMLALNSLLQRDPAQAIPTIRTILTGNSSPELKQHALTALGMSQSADAQSLLRDVATGKVAPAQQRGAIQMLGVFSGRRADDMLANIYRTSPDGEIKRAVVTALFISGDAPRMVDLARNEKDLGLKHDIVSKLALMQDKVATDYMLELLK